MTKLPTISGQETIKKLIKVGYFVARQKGSHIRLKHPNPDKYKSITIPNHPFLKPGLLRKIIRDANLSVEEFINL